VLPAGVVGGSQSAESLAVFELFRTRGSRAPEPPICADVGLAPIKTKAVQIWESCAHEVHAGRSRSGRNRR
jgi:hypothetical protein